ncbi:hypothetical protein [Streptomyces lydicus]|uniref:hypothetical protein n=1 Tax=Streptomyces lydicus TaxID=47763 RepID=UPI0036E91852
MSTHLSTREHREDTTMATVAEGPRPTLSLVKDAAIEGNVVEHQGETLRPAWIASGRELATRAQEHATENRLYIGWAARGYRNLGRRWLEARRDDYPQMIQSAKAAVKAAAGDPAAETAAKELVVARRAEYRLHKRWHWIKTGGWSATTIAAATVAAVTGGFGVDLLMTGCAMVVGAFHGRPGSGSSEAVPDGELPDAPQHEAVEAAPSSESTAPSVRGAEDLITALVKAGIIEKSERDETSVIGVIRSEGPGWTATVELPAGGTAAEAIAKIGPLASALKVKAGQLELSADTSEDGHEGQFSIWVANNDNPFGEGKTRSELAAAEVWDFWANGVPLGLDARRTRRYLDLLWTSLLIGGLKGYGKSYLARLIAAAAALDPYVRIIVIVGKSGPDWAPLKKVAHAYVSGSTPEKLRQIHDVLDDTIADMQQRGEDLERLFETDPGSCPEGKLTRVLASQPGRGLTLLLVDELQELLLAAAMTKVKVGGEDEEEGGRGRSGKVVLVEKFARFVNVTRYVGGMGLFVTQRPDASSVPTELREVCDKRASARVKGANSARMVLGDEAVAAGAAPHMLREVHQGVFVLDEGAESGHVTLKADAIDLPEFGKICERGQRLRVEAGTLTGYAAQHARAAVAAARVAELRVDAVAVFDQLKVPEDRGLTADALVDALRASRSDRYAQLDADGLRDRLRAVGITTDKVLTPGGKRLNGFTRDQLAGSTAAIS